MAQGMLRLQAVQGLVQLAVKAAGNTMRANNKKAVQQAELGFALELQGLTFEVVVRLPACA